MNSVIQAIYESEAYKTEDTVNSKKYKQMQKNAEILYSRFINTLDGKQLIMFEEVLDCLFGLNGELTEADFDKGFKLGLALAIETIQ